MKEGRQRNSGTNAPTNNFNSQIYFSSGNQNKARFKIA
jgi:hypothetical protein